MTEFLDGVEQGMRRPGATTTSAFFTDEPLGRVAQLLPARSATSGPGGRA